MMESRLKYCANETYCANTRSPCEETVSLSIESDGDGEEEVDS